MNIREKIELEPQHPAILRTIRQYSYMLYPVLRQDAD